MNALKILKLFTFPMIHIYCTYWKKHNGRFKLKKLHIDLKSLTHWLPANKISLNVTKTELIYFRGNFTSVEKPSKAVKLNGVKIEPLPKVRYLGLIFDEFLSWNPHKSILLAKLKRANNLISIARHYVPKKHTEANIFWTISFACIICLSSMGKFYRLRVPYYYIAKKICSCHVLLSQSTTHTSHFQRA